MSLTYSPEQVHPEHGPLCYLCDIEDVAAVSETPRSQTVVTVETVAEVEPTVVTVVPRDSIRRRVFLEPLGVLISVMAGALQSVAVDVGNRSFTVPSSGE